MEQLWSPRLSQAQTRKNGNEAFRFSSIDAAVTIHDYWVWANSDLLDNTSRGTLAEFLVAHALRRTSELYRNWDAYDIQSANGLRVEVKSSAYAQSWPQKNPSKISFDIAPRSEVWNSRTNEYCKIDPPERIADVYVFCLLGSHDNPFPDPMDLDQWRFFVVATTLLDQIRQNKKSISLGQLECIENDETDILVTEYGKLKGVIEAIVI